MLRKKLRDHENVIARLTRENEALRKQLGHANQRTALLDKTPLPKCESMACTGCVHAVFQEVPGGGYHLIGCGKALQCEDYLPVVTALAARQEATRRALQAR